MSRIPISRLLLVVCAGMIVMQCSNPAKPEPFQWRWSGEVPFTNEQFILAEEFVNLWPNITNDTLDTSGALIIVGALDSIDGDTISLGARADTTTTFVIDHDQIEEQTFERGFGNLAITGFGNKILPVPLGTQVDYESDSVFYMRFASASPALTLTVTNSSSNTLGAVTVAVGGLGNVNIGTLAPGAVGQAAFDVAGASIDSTLSVSVSATGGGAGDFVTIGFTFDNLIADSLVVLDYLVQFSRAYENNHEMTDSLDIHYVDVHTGNFQYKLINSTDLDLNVTGVHDNVWESNESAERRVESITQLSAFSTAQDTLFYFKGSLTPAGQAIRVLPRSTLQFGTLDLNTKRLFPVWQDSVSVSHVSYQVSSFPASGRRVSISAADKFTFVITPITFKLDKLKGTIREAYEQASDTTVIEVPFPWENASKDSLRYRFFLDSVMAHIDLGVRVAEEALLDSFFIQMAFYDSARSVVVDYATGLKGVRNDTTYRRSIDITDIVNLFPDKVNVFAKIILPVGSTVLVVNDRRHLTDQASAVNQMTLNLDFAYRLQASFDYHVTDTASLDLGYGDFDMPGATRFIGKMQERAVSMIMDIENHTNVYVRMFGLIGPGDKRFALETLSTDSLTRLVRTPGVPDGFVNLLGTSGILIPDRNQTHRDTILLDEPKLAAMFDCEDCDKAGWRWLLQFLPKTRDQLLDTNFIEIKSKFRVEGIQSTDSLLIWD